MLNERYFVVNNLKSSNLRKFKENVKEVKKFEFLNVMGEKIRGELQDKGVLCIRNKRRS